jgi:hypothetical protein
MKGRQITALATALAIAAAVALPAGAAPNPIVKCVGTADFCGATVSIAGGASDRHVTVRLTDTDLRLVAVRAIPASSRGAFSITHPSYRLGGSEARFTLNAVKANPPRARIILLFAAGAAAQQSPHGGVGGVCLSCWRP